MPTWYLIVPIVVGIYGTFMWIILLVEIYKSRKNDNQLPEGEELDRLAAQFPAPQEWHDEWM